MSDDKKGKAGAYDVGYGKPPKHTQYVPGQGGFIGRKKKRPEPQANIVARVRDELVVINGRSITKFELAVVQTVNQTIKSGKPRDLKLMFEVLDKYGAMPVADLYEETRAGAEHVMNKISDVVDRLHNLDPMDRPLREAEDNGEMKLVMSCPHCAPELRRRWADSAYKALAKRYERSGLHSLVFAWTKRTSS